MRDALLVHVGHALQDLLHEPFDFIHFYLLLFSLMLLDNFFQVVFAEFENQVLGLLAVRAFRIVQIEHLDHVLAVLQLPQYLPLSAHEFTRLLGSLYRDTLFRFVVNCLEHKAEGATTYDLLRLQLGVAAHFLGLLLRLEVLCQVLTVVVPGSTPVLVLHLPRIGLLSLSLVLQSALLSIV